MVRKYLKIDNALCTGCGICQLVCAAFKDGQWNPSLGRIKVIGDYQQKKGLGFTCAQCEEPPCATACLMDVIYKNEKTGITMRNIGQCIGCRACEIACPFSAAIYDEDNGKVHNCDLCNGKPMCVEYCPSHALSFTSTEEKTGHNRDAGSRLVMGMLLPDGQEARKAADCEEHL